jgi:cbb3-type cytochrome oxidase subunit 3
MFKLFDYNFWFIAFLFISYGVTYILFDPHVSPVLRGSVAQTANGELMSAGPRYLLSKCFTLDRNAISWAHQETGKANKNVSDGNV